MDVLNSALVGKERVFRDNLNARPTWFSSSLPLFFSFFVNMSVLDQIKQYTTIVADSGDFESMSYCGLNAKKYARVADVFLV